VFVFKIVRNTHRYSVKKMQIFRMLDPSFLQSKLMLSYHQKDTRFLRIRSSGKWRRILW